jgi:hypothetical protein
VEKRRPRRGNQYPARMMGIYNACESTVVIPDVMPTRFTPNAITVATAMVMARVRVNGDEELNN